MNEETMIGIIDLGTPEQVAKLYDIRELIGSSATPIALGETKPSQWKIYPKRDQKQSSSCVYQARAKAAGILREQETGEFVVYSAADYNKRSNKPAEGAYPVEAFDFWVNEGIGLEILEPSQGLSEAELSLVKQDQFDKEVAKISAIKKYVRLTGYSFDNMIATLKATGKPIPVGFFGTSKEWNQDIPQILNPDLQALGAPVRHEVCATANYGIYEGKEGFTIEDSWGSTGINGKGVRWITREFFELRNYIPGLYPTTFKTYSDVGVLPSKPKVNLPKDLEFGMEDSDVFKLQQVLKYENLFPVNHAGSNFFLNITLDAVKKFQVRYNIAGPSDGGYGRVGPKTRKVINTLYS